MEDRDGGEGGGRQRLGVVDGRKTFHLLEKESHCPYFCSFLERIGS